MNKIDKKQCKRGREKGKANKGHEAEKSASESRR